MALVTSNEVLAIMPEVEAGTDVAPYITVADLIVTEQLVPTGMTADRLKQVELWLAAHFTSVVYQKTASEGVKALSQVFQTKVDLNFNVTVYGQQALLLDNTGTLASLQAQAEGKRIRFTPRMEWLGSEVIGNEEV